MVSKRVVGKASYEVRGTMMTAGWTKAWVVAGMLIGSCAQADTLYQRDGITLDATVRIAGRGAGVCHVLEESHPPEVYERMKANEGQPLHVWRMEFAARNGSGRRLEHLTANLTIASDRPPCTNWSGPRGGYPKTVQWANSLQVLQKAYGIEPGGEVRDAVFVLAFHDREPTFECWRVDYRFAAVSDESGVSPASAVIPQPSARATREQENLFWQSIINSKNPAEFEAYLAQFPDGVFRALAEARLAAVRYPHLQGPGTVSDDRPSDLRGLPESGVSPPVVSSSAAEPSVLDALEPTWPEQAEGAGCWMELSNHPGCQVWTGYYLTGETAKGGWFGLQFGAVAGVCEVRPCQWGSQVPLNRIGPLEGLFDFMLDLSCQRDSPLQQRCRRPECGRDVEAFAFGAESLKECSVLDSGSRHSGHFQYTQRAQEATHAEC